MVTLGGRNIMFDCGMHMGYNDERRFPDFTLLSPSGDFDQVIDCLVITHFHLDHCGALPYFTEMCGYRGPVVMTHPTKALCPVLLEDYRKITVDRRGESNFFTSAMIEASLGRVRAVDVHETVQLGEDFEVKAYYAGHVLGAAMFFVRVGSESCLYTGDYNMTPDRHLGAAWVDRCQPDVLITESTYATTLRESKRTRERDFLRKVHAAVAGGGKVLIPVFALGRVQELCILIDAYWERMGLAAVPVYFSAGMAATATEYYRLYLDWTNEHIKQRTARGNPFDFKHIRPFEKHYAEQDGPMVLFSTPGMLHSGTSLDVFKRWCAEPKNMLIIPGYCVAGTVGAKVLAGQKTIELTDAKGKQVLQVHMQVRNLSFSAHADAKGILQLVKDCAPRNVVLVHGEAAKMGSLRDMVKRQFGLPCFMPANGELLQIQSAQKVPLRLDTRFIKDRRAAVRSYCKSVVSSVEEPKRCELLAKLVQKQATKPQHYIGVLEWTKEEIDAGQSPRIITVEIGGDHSLQYEIHLSMSRPLPLETLHRIFIECLVEDPLLVSLEENAILIGDNAVRVRIGDEPNRLLFSWSLAANPLGHRLIALFATHPLIKPTIQL